jgi:hypothetical protein
MIKNHYSILMGAVLGLATTAQALAQCGTCTPNEALLSPASNYPDGALSPDPAPPITQGTPYDEVITYVMPATYDVGPPVGVVNVDQVLISNIAGLPAGIQWNCNNPTCTYFPQTYQYGCIRFCGTTFAAPGVYPVTVTVIGTALGQSQPTSFNTSIEVLPATGGNTGFSFSPVSACDAIAVTFEALIDGAPQPTTYDWDFGNGNTSTVADPPVQNYSGAGDYIINLETTIWDYQITSVSASTTSSQWCGDIEEPSFFGACTGSPDMVFDLSQGSGQIVYSGAEVGNNTSASWSGINTTLSPQNGPYTFHFQDVDNVSQWDDLGTLSFNLTNPGTFQLSGPHVTVQYTIALVPASVITNTDTVTVYASPTAPTLSAGGPTSICVGDSVQLTANGPSNLDYQWSVGGVPIPGATGQSIYVSTTGQYDVTVTDPVTTCFATSGNIVVITEAYPPTPVIALNSAGGYIEVTNAGTNNIQWYLDGTMINGATSATYNDLSVSGPYTVTLTSPIGCSSESFPYSLCLTGTTVTTASNDTLCCGETMQFIASGFTLNNSSIVAWGITPQADGPITDQAGATAAQAAGMISGQLGDTLNFTRSCGTILDSLATGDYYITPFAIQDPSVTPFTWDTLQGCRPYGSICPVLTGDDNTWEIFPMIFTFPDGSNLNVNDALAFGLPLNQTLIDLAGGLPCIPLTSIFAGNPNGVWSVSITNTSAVGITMDVPDFVVINSADSCNLITQDEIYTIPGLTVYAPANSTVVVNFNIPPVPGDFPSVDPNCGAFGTPYLVHFVDCYPELTNTLELTGTVGNVSTFGGSNGFIDVTTSGGFPPYTWSWTDGPTSEDRFNLTAGTYTVTVTDNSGFQVTETFTVTQPPMGVDELTHYGFSLGQNEPNPFNTTSVISYRATKAGQFTFDIHGVDGKVVLRRAVTANPGENRIIIDRAGLAPGVYMYSLSNGSDRLSRRMVIQD